MTIARRPHPVFASVWGVLVLAMLVAGVIGLRGHWQGVAASLVLLAIAVWEGVAVVYRSPEKLRDTLSEITTYVNHVLVKPVVPGWLRFNPLWGWNTLVTIQAAALGRLIYVVGVFWGGTEVQPYALFVAATFAVGQLAHWLATRWTG